MKNKMNVPHPNWIEIDLDNLQSNIKYIKSLLPKGVKMLMPVKADAYGHGSLAVSLSAVQAGVDFLGVAHLFEAVALRKNGIDVPVLILGPCVRDDFEFLLRYNLTPSISDFETAKALSEFLVEQNKTLKIHIQIDTGMHRFGIDCRDLGSVEKICRLPNLEIDGMYSHLATADSNREFTLKQVENFDKVVQHTEAKGLRPKICHLANSPATFIFANGSDKKALYNMVRPGIALYGYDPFGKFPSDYALKPVLRLRSTVRALRVIEAGEGVSYGQFWVADKRTTVATVAIGYGDGYLRGEPGKGVLFIKGKPCRILGRVCMDACMADVSEISDVKIGDIVECINGAFDSRISMENFAAEHHTISYEIATRMARRLCRLYKYKGEIMNWDEVKKHLS